MDDQRMLPRSCTALCLALAGCTITGTGVVVTVEGAGITVDAIELVATSSSGKSAPRVLHPEAAVALPSSLVAKLPDRADMVSFDVTGLLEGNVVGHGHTPTVAVQPHQLATVSVDLRDGSGDMAGADLVAADMAGADLVDESADMARPPWIVQRTGTGTVTAIWGSSPTDLYAACKGCGATTVLRSGDRGRTWTESSVSGIAPNALWGSGPTDVFAVGDANATFHSDGTGFKSQPNPALVSTDFWGVWGTGAGAVYAVGSGNTVLRFSTTWLIAAPAPPSVGATLRDIWGVANDDFYVVGTNGTILHATVSGWVAEKSGVAVDLNGVWGIADEVYAVGGSGTILHRSGGAWSHVTVDGGNLYGVWGPSGAQVFVVGAGGLILRSDDHGAHWNPEPSGTMAQLARVWGAGATEIYAVGAGGTILRRP